MRIVTFNIQHGRTPAGPVDTAALARYCAGLDADVLALEEVDVGVRRSGGLNQAAEVARTTGMTPLFGEARRLGWRGRYGIVLLVRGLVGEPVALSLPKLHRHHERRVAVVATAEVGGRRLSVAATHLSVNREEAVVQLGAVLATLVLRPGPRVVLGDLNLRPDRALPVLAGHGFAVADTAVPTYPAAGPFLRLDHVAVDGLTIDRTEVLAAAPVSDHRPLVVEAR